MEPIVKKIQSGMLSLANTERASKVCDDLFKIHADYSCSACLKPIAKIGLISAYETIQCIHCGIDLKFVLWSKNTEDVWKVTLTAIN